MHLIRVAEHLGVRLPASPPPRAWTTKNSSSSGAGKWALTSMRTECEKHRKMRQKTDSANHPGARRLPGSESTFIGKNVGNSPRRDRRLTHKRESEIDLRSVSTFTMKLCEIRPTATEKGRIDLGIRGPPSRNEMREIPRPP